MSFGEMLLRYSALGNDTPRARLAETYTATHGPASWHRVRAYAERIADGLVRDPCRGAVHWGGTMDKPRGRMVPARCSAPTRNTFYALASNGRGK